MHFKCNSIFVMLLIGFQSSAMEMRYSLDNKDDLFPTLTSKQIDNLLGQWYDHFIDEHKDIIDREHRPTVVLLSGCAGMGKTTTASALRNSLGLLHFNGDAARRWLKSKGYFNGPVETAEVKIRKVVLCFSSIVKKLKQSSYPNKALIFDESIDRTLPCNLYEIITSFLNGEGYKKITVQLQVSKEIALRRLLEREKDNQESTEHFNKHFDQYYESYQKFDETRVDISVDASREGHEHIPSLCEEVKQKMEDNN